MTDAVSSARFPALGSSAIVAVLAPDRLAAARSAVQRVVDAFDHACSRFRADSELCAVNAAAGSPVRVGALLLDAVEAALRAARLSAGDVDPTIGQALIALGYDRDFAAMESKRTVIVSEARRAVRLTPVPGWRSVRVDREASTVQVGRGVQLDLGATAKALAADRAARAAAEATAGGALVGLGGDIALAGETPSEGWRVRVTDDHAADLDAPGQWITLRSGGLATSSTTVRRWRADDGREAHHLINPSTSVPAANVWRTVTVAAASCLDANIASTASIVRGESAVAWLTSQRLPSRLVAADGTVRHIAGWPAQGEELPCQR